MHFCLIQFITLFDDKQHRPPVHQDKQYSESCHMSSECDISRGLCCQLQRRHRQLPRKVTLSDYINESIFGRIMVFPTRFAPTSKILWCVSVRWPSIKSKTSSNIPRAKNASPDWLSRDRQCIKFCFATKR